MTDTEHTASGSSEKDYFTNFLQICFLTVESDPQQTQCLTVCNAKICCIAQVSYDTISTFYLNTTFTLFSFNNCNTKLFRGMTCKNVS